jgi:hypothetical protein
MKNEQKPESHSKTNSTQQNLLSFGNSEPEDLKKSKCCSIIQGAMEKCRTLSFTYSIEH